VVGGHRDIVLVNRCCPEVFDVAPAVWLHVRIDCVLPRSAVEARYFAFMRCRRQDALDGLALSELKLSCILPQYVNM
jgi:hypothetical protein